MNKIIITLAALAAFSTASLAGQRTDVDPRDATMGDVNSTGSASYRVGVGGFSSGSATFAIEDNQTSGLTAFKRVTLQSIQNENSRNN